VVDVLAAGVCPGRVRKAQREIKVEDLTTLYLPAGASTDRLRMQVKTANLIVVSEHAPRVPAADLGKIGQLAIGRNI
jgi:hypothetical protein